MLNLRKLPLALGLPAAFLAGLTADPVLAPTQDPAPKTVVVDIDRVLKAYPGAEARQEHGHHEGRRQGTAAAGGRAAAEA